MIVATHLGLTTWSQQNSFFVYNTGFSEVMGKVMFVVRCWGRRLNRWGDEHPKDAATPADRSTSCEQQSFSQKFCYAKLQLICII